MRKGIYSVLLSLLVVLFYGVDVAAQVRVARSEFLCYDRREDANKDIRTTIDKHIVIAPEEQFRADDGKVRAVYEQTFEIPATWQDYNAYLHMENVGGDYTIFFNGKQITTPLDKYTPVDLFVSPYLEQGENIFAVVVVEEESMRLLDEGLKMAERKQFENCYLFAQRKLGIYDYNVHLRPDSLGRFAELRLDIIADNSFSTNEVINVGYDIYTPDGKLAEYSVNDVEMEGFTRDTVCYSPYIYNSNPNRWSPKNPKLYDLML